MGNNINEILNKEHDDSSTPSVKKGGLYGWDSDNLAWTKLKVDSTGEVIIDPTNLDARYLKLDNTNVPTANYTWTTNLTTTGTVTAEQITSTDDASIAGNLSVTGDVDIGGTGSQKIYAISTDTDEAVGLQGMFYTHNVTTGTVAQTVVANNYQALATVAAGADNNGVLRAMQMTAIASAMDGEHQGVYGFNLRCGMQNTSDGLLKNAEGIAVDMWSRAGTITNLKGIAIRNPFTGGTVTSGYGIWDESPWNWALDGDSKKILFGEGQDASIYYDGTDFCVDPAEIGSGAVKVLGDTYFSGSGSGLPYAQIYEEDGASTLALAAQDTFYQITAFSADGESNLCTPDHTNDHITIVKTGKYLVNCSVAFSQTTAVGIEYDFHIQKNNGATDFACTSMHRNSGGSNAVGNAATSGILDLTAGDTVEMWVERLDGGAVSRTITIQQCTIVLTQLGG